MAFPNKILPHYTYDDYCRWEGRWELIDGIPYAMSPMPKPEHQNIAGNLHAEFRAAIRKSGCDCKVYQPLDYKISEDTILNPDLLIVCQPITKAYLDFVPDLVAEISSESTFLKDRHTKYEIYQSQGIPYYVLIDANKKSVELFQLINSVYEQKAVEQKQPFPFTVSGCLFHLIFDNIWS